MYCEPQVKKRLIAAVLLVCFIVVSLLSAAFILTHAEHDHDHNGFDGACAVCARLQNAENALKQLVATAAGLLSALGGLFAAAVIIKAIYSDIATPSPVVLKIRMNN